MNYLDLTIPMRKKSASVQVSKKTKTKKNNEQLSNVSIDNYCNVHHCKSNCNLFKFMPTNVSM